MNFGIKDSNFDAKEHTREMPQSTAKKPDQVGSLSNQDEKNLDHKDETIDQSKPEF